jgi:hypothetical protein
LARSTQPEVAEHEQDDDDSTDKPDHTTVRLKLEQIQLPESVTSSGVIAAKSLM